MTDWHNKIRRCACGKTFSPKRERQRHCSRKCRVASAVNKSRSDYTPTAVQEKRLQAPSAVASGPDWPICPICHKWALTPRGGLPRQMFCLALRKPRLRLVVSNPPNCPERQASLLHGLRRLRKLPAAELEVIEDCFRDPNALFLRQGLAEAGDCYPLKREGDVEHEVLFKSPLGHNPLP